MIDGPSNKNSHFCTHTHIHTHQHISLSSHLCHRAGHPNLCHTHTSRVQCKCHDHTQETSRTHRTDHPSSHNDIYRERNWLLQTLSEKKTQTKASRCWIRHASALSGACREGVIFLKLDRLTCSLQADRRSRVPSDIPAYTPLQG